MNKDCRHAHCKMVAIWNLQMLFCYYMHGNKANLQNYFFFQLSIFILRFPGSILDIRDFAVALYM